MAAVPAAARATATVVASTMIRSRMAVNRFAARPSAVPVVEAGGHLGACQQGVEPPRVPLVIGLKRRQHVAAFFSCEARV